MLFINQTTPYLRIYNPVTEAFAEFKGGKLELDPGDPDFEVVKAEALRNPAIVILENATTCPLCGEAFAGKTAAAQLGKHRKDVHFSEWVADKEAEQGEAILREVKARAPYACDLCPRVQEFGSQDELMIHIAAVHRNVELDDNGNVIGDGAGGGDNAADAVAAEPPAAVVK